MSKAIDPISLVDRLSTHWSPDLGETDGGKIRCALCQHAPCDCPEFGTPEYLALCDRRHPKR